MGNRSRRVDGTGTEAYAYDSLYRLTDVTYGNGDTQSYTLDAQGNRLTKVHNGTTTTSTYDDADEMTATGGLSYSYDNAGNQTAAGSDTFTWDAENRLTATNIASVSGSYAYNGDGTRTSRTVAGSTVTYIWDQSGGLPNVLQDSASNRYAYGLDLISTEASGGALTYSLYDGLGSTTGLAGGTGTVTGGYTYDVYGAARTQTGATTEWNYTGEQNDPTGLEFLRARYYDKANGRFVSQDPLPLTQRYAYVGGDPVNLIDPSGLEPDEPVPFPVPVPGSEDDINACYASFVRCIEETAPEQRDIRNEELRQKGKKLLPLVLFNNVWDDMLGRCLREASANNGAQFDFGEAKRLMQDIDRGSKFKLRLPGTGTGGFQGVVNPKESSISWIRPACAGTPTW